MRRMWLLTLALVVAVACTTPLGIQRDEAAPIQTRALSYTLREVSNGFASRVDLTYTFRNVTEAPVFIMSCGGRPAVKLQRLEGSSWVSVWPSGGFSCEAPLAVVEPGGVWQGRVRLEGAAPGCACFPEFSTRPEGVHRIVLDNVVLGHMKIGGTLFRGKSIPLPQRVSNRFKIRVT